jgi:peptide/nickel transport system substrate-binding protein
LRQGVTWHNKPPLHGRELVAEDMKFTYERFLSEPANPLRFTLESVGRIEVVDRYTVKFLLKEPFAWLVNALVNPYSAEPLLRRAATAHRGHPRSSGDPG